MLTLLISLLVLTSVIVLLARAITQDGYGTRPGPRSHAGTPDPRNHLR